jgi:hypothetical protein
MEIILTPFEIASNSSLQGPFVNLMLTWVKGRNVKLILRKFTIDYEMVIKALNP